VSMINYENTLLQGFITSRKCDACGHHEMGIETPDGKFHPLRSGMPVQVLKDISFPTMPQAPSPTVSYSAEQETDPMHMAVWIPEPFLEIKELRLKFGVWIDADFDPKNMSGTVYKMAFIQKLSQLIEKEVDIPLAVILDRYFTMPQLASGDSPQVALAMFDTLDEIYDPVQLCMNWIDHGNSEDLGKIMASVQSDTSRKNPVNSKEQEKELSDLTLEDFIQFF